MDKVVKAFSVVSKTIDLDAGIFEAMISTEAVDRQGDIVRATGAQLENYLKNPVVLWAHDYAQPPVAKALSIEIMPGSGLKATFQFPEWNMNPHADVVRRMWAGGFLNATSIGFMPLKSKPIDGTKDEDVWWVPQEYTSWELLEFSIVPVPANQEALRLALTSLVPTTKRGRVLSSANEKKLKEAADLITDVLSQLGESEPEEESLPAKADTEAPESESNTDPTSNDTDEELVKAFENLINILSGE